MLFDFIKRFWLVNPTVKFLPSFGGAGLNNTNLTKALGQNALRVKTSTSGTLYRTPVATGNTKKFTLSLSLKRCNLNSAGVVGIFGIYNHSSYPNLVNNNSYFAFSNDKLTFVTTGATGVATIQVSTDAVFRDTNAPYHIVFSLDTSQATAAAGLLIWVNGVLQPITSTTWTQNAATFINTTKPHYIGRTFSSSAGTPVINQSDCIISEVNFLDGIVASATAFGALDTTVNSWAMSSYSGSYGTNGFYLPFSDPTSFETLGYDTTYSGSSFAVKAQLDTNSTGWTSYGYRQYIDGSAVEYSGNSIRLTLSGGTSGVNIAGMKIGYKATSGNPWDFSGNQVQVTFGGSNAVSIAASGTVVSDWITFPLVSNLAQGYIIAIAFDSTGSGTVMTETANQVYNVAGVYTAIVPPGVTSITYTAVGAGGGGGGGGWSGSGGIGGGGGGGGGAGNQITNTVNVTPGQKLVITVGAAGMGGGGGSYSAGGSGSAGGATYISDIVIAAGGAGGGGGGQESSPTGGTAGVTAGTGGTIGTAGTTGSYYNGAPGGSGGYRTATVTQVKGAGGGATTSEGPGKNGGNGSLGGGGGGGGGGLYTGGNGQLGGGGGKGGAGYVSITYNNFSSTPGYPVVGYQKAADSANALNVAPSGYTIATNPIILISGIEVPGNHFNPVGISLTNGTGYDVLKDNNSNNHPTLTQAYGASFLSAPISNGGLTAIASSINAINAFGSFALPRSGKWYFEVECIADSLQFALGVTSKPSSQTITADTNASSICNDGTRYIAGSAYIYTSAWNQSGRIDIVGVYFDADTGNLRYSLNGVLLAVAATLNRNVAWFPMVSLLGSGSATFNFNFGQQPFAYPPIGYNKLCALTMPDSAIKNPENYFDAIPYAGTGSARSISSAAFQPDLVWLKNRMAVSSSNCLYDVVRGSSNCLFSDQTSAQYSNGADGITGFLSNGFSLSGSGTNIVYYNRAGSSYISWLFKAGGTKVTNNDGTIQSQVSANQTSGFSIVSYVGNGAAGSTVGHGLNSAPELVITKSWSSVGANYQWPVYHVDVGPANFTLLNTTKPAAANSTLWNGNTPDQSKINLGNHTYTNAAGISYISYCFSEVPGFSKIGSYTGNGSTDGTFVYCGFRPKFIMIKRTDANGNWEIIDVSRSPINPAAAYLYPNLINAEGGSAFPLDIYSNGFKFYNTTGDNNNSGGTFIFMAIADTSLKYANGR